MLDEMVFLSATLSFIPSSDFLCLLVLVSVFGCFLNPLLRPQKPSRRKRKEKKKKGDEKANPLADHWSMTQLWNSLPSNQIVRLQGARSATVLPPGHSVSPASFEGLTRIFLSCQGRVMGAKENRGVQRSPHSQISPGCATLNWVIKEAAEAGTTKATNPNTSLTFKSLE